MLSPIKTLFMYFPVRAYSTVLLMLCIGWYSCRRIRKSVGCGIRSKESGILLWILINYIVLLLFFTVFGRRSLDYYRYNFEVGYSYRDVWNTGDAGMAKQIAVNIAVFIPVGILGNLLDKGRGKLGCLLLGLGLSLCIELLQLVLRCGTTEIDDLISNSLGTLSGCVLAWIVAILFDHHKKVYQKTAEP